jgi:hypothetical protein
MIAVAPDNRCMTTTSSTLTLRSATADDAPWLERLAALDSATVPEGRIVVAERDGQLIAAISERTLKAIADPFERTADAVALLRTHVLTGDGARKPRRRLSLVPRPA